jgi:hypothetical protein
VSRATGLPAMTEKEWLAQVRELAETLGWWCYHPYLSIHSPRGWPDLALCRPPRLILAELKRETGELSKSQVPVIELLRQCPGVEVYVWRPSDFDEVARVLRRRAVRAEVML